MHTASLARRGSGPAVLVGLGALEVGESKARSYRVGARPSKGHSRLTVKTLPVRDGPNYEAAASGDVQLAQKRACRQELGWKRSALPEVLTSAVPDLPLLILGSRAPKMRVKARSGNGPEPGLASLIRARGDRALSVSFDRRQSPVCFIRSDSLRS